MNSLPSRFAIADSVGFEKGSSSGRSPDADLCELSQSLCNLPILQVLGAEKSRDAVEQRFATRLRNANQQKAVVRSCHVLACVRKIEVLSDQKSTVDLTPIPHDAVVSPGNAFVGNRADVVPEVAEGTERDDAAGSRPA